MDVPQAGAAHQGLQAGTQFAGAGRLDHEVVGTGIQRADDLALGVLRGEHHDRQRVLAFAQQSHQRLAVHARQHEVDDAGIEALTRQGRQEGRGLVEKMACVPFHAERMDQLRSHCLVVFNDRYSHRRILSHVPGRYVHRFILGTKFV